MKACPHCNAPYQDGRTLCERCGHALDAPMFTDMLETFSQADLMLIKSVLEAEGIEYYVLGEHAATYTYHALPMILRVRTPDAERAREIVQDIPLSFYPSAYYHGLEGFMQDDPADDDGEWSRYPPPEE